MTARRRAVGDGRRSGRRAGTVLRVLVPVPLATSLLAGCGGSPAGPAAASPSAPGSLGTVTVAPDGVQEVTLQTQDDYVFTPDRFTVRPGTVRLTVVNAAEQLTHNFRFTPDRGPEPIEPEVPLLGPGQSETIEFTVGEPGEHPFECTFHIQLNQVGTMTVRG